jgi:hypothetical protein
MAADSAYRYPDSFRMTRLAMTRPDFVCRSLISMRARLCFGLLWALLMPAAAAAAAGAGATLRYEEGVARNPDSGIEMYREQHWLRSEGGRPIERLVLYRCPNGIAFGRKQVDYRQSTTAPAFRFDDLRSGYVEGLRDDGSPRAFVRPVGQELQKSADLSSKQLVVDAGFDEFVHNQWQALLTGRSLPIDFVVPSRLESIAFTVRSVGAAQVDGESAWVFRLRLDSVIGWLAPHIDVSYSQQSRRLLRFEGLSNLRDDAGRKQLTARIDFPQPDRAVADDQWQSALTTPLSACAIGR